MSFNFFILFSAQYVAGCVLHPGLKSLEHRADSLAGIEQLDKAIEVYRNILELQDNQRSADYPILYKLGHASVMAGREMEALGFLKEAFDKAHHQGDTQMVARIYTDLGRAYEYIGNPDSAFYYYSKALLIWEMKNDLNYIAGGYQNIAQVLRIINRREEARFYIRKALGMVSKVSDPKIIANIYNETAYLFELCRQLDSAKLYYGKLIESSKNYHNLKGVSAGYSNLASVLTLENNYREALKYYNLGLEIDLELDYDYYIACSYRGISSCYYGMGDYTKALHYIGLSDQYMDENWLNENFINEEWKYKIHKAAGDYRKALSAHEKYKIMEDSLLDIENQKNISEILTQYETEKKDSQIQMMAQTNRINDQKIKIQSLVLVIFGFLLLTIALITNSIIQLKNKRISQMERELQNYASQIPSTTQTFPSTNGNQAIEDMMALGLTKREVEILDLIKNGLTNEEISEKLFVSKNTIKFHIKNIYIKLDVKNRAQALKMAFVQ